MLADAEKAAARRATWFSSWAWGWRSLPLGEERYSPQAMVALERGAKFVIAGHHELVPATEADMVTAQVALRDVKTWLGLKLAYYLEALDSEGRDIFKRVSGDGDGADLKETP